LTIILALVVRIKFEPERDNKMLPFGLGVRSEMEVPESSAEMRP